MASQSPAPEDRIGPYVLEERIGRGGFGEVWRARHSVLDQGTVAAKIPTDGAYIGVLRTEGILQHGLKHPLIVEMIDIDLDHDPPYLIMEHVQGEDLRKRIRRDAPMPMQDVISISRDILEALDHAHTKGIVHRDLKPENVLLPASGGIKLTDFGLGKAMDASRSILLKSQTMRSEEVGQVAGTLAYMAPEQFGTSRTIDARTDLYAFGILFFEMITGQLPVGPTLPSEIIPGLNPTADRIYRRCCAPIQGRYGSASGRIMDDLATLAPPPKRQPTPLPEGFFGPVVDQEFPEEPLPEPTRPKKEPIDLDEWKGPVTWFLGVFFIWILISPAILGLAIAVFQLDLPPRTLATWWIVLNILLTIGLFTRSSQDRKDGVFQVISPDHADDPFRGKEM